MRWRIALRAKIIDCVAQASAKKLSPEPVHKHASSQRILRRYEPASEIETIERARIGVRRRRQKLRRRRLDNRAAFILPVAARQDTHGQRIGRDGDERPRLAVAALAQVGPKRFVFGESSRIPAGPS